MINKNLHFCIESQRLGKYRTVKISNTKNGEFVEVIPEMGGLINDAGLSYNNQLVSIIEGYSSEEELKNTFGSTYKSCYLFPFPNRIKDGVYTFNDQEYHVDINFPQENNSIHGIVFDANFEVRETLLSEKEATLKLRYVSDGSHPGYPFKYEIRIFYTLDNRSNIKVTTKILNKEDNPILFGEGWHPYFRTGSKVDDLKLMLKTNTVFEVDDRMIPTGIEKSYTDFINLKNINGTHFDTCYSLPSEEKDIYARIVDESKNVGYDIWFEGHKYMQVYTPVHRRTVAIEPMTCIPDAFNNKVGIKYLPPEEEIEFSWGINKTMV